MHLKHVLFLLLSFVTAVVESSTSSHHRILVVAPHGTKSHHNMMVPLVKELARRGHQLTVITNYVANDLQELENVRDIVMDQLAIDMSQYPNIFDMITTPGSFTKYLNYIQVIVGAMLKTAPHTAQETFSDPRIKDLIQNEPFDLVMISEACPLIGYAMAWHFQSPFIMLSPNVLFPGRASSLGDSEQYSYAPFLFTRFSDRMTFSQRMINMIAANAFDWIHTRWHEPVIRSIIRQQVMPDCPPLYDIEKNISLVFTNTHPSFTYPRTLPPQVIEVGGIHCRPAKTLPDDLETFVSSSSNGDGFIIFAIGSAIKMDDMPDEMMRSFIKAFSRLSQRVIWQWKGTPRSDLPSNVLAIPWLPQQDLLGHKNCRAFMTHGGLNSLQEAIYHGVPVIGLPFGTDQFINLDKGAKDGYAIRLDWTEVREETLTNAIHKLLHNPSYEIAAERLSSLFHQQLQPPLERAVFWTEFVLRHNGTDHLRLGSRDLSPLQRNLIDVYLILFLSAILPFVFLLFCLRKCCCRSRRNKNPIEVNNLEKKIK